MKFSQMKNAKREQENKISALKSVRGKTIILVDIVILIMMIVLLANVVPKAQRSMKNATQNYLADMALAYGTMIENECADNGNETELTPDELKSQLAEVGVKGIKSSYAYVVDKNATMLYHPTASKIGQPVENTVVKGLVAQIQAGTIPESSVTSYNFNGVIKYASYYVAPDGAFILVISADESEVMKPVNDMFSSSVVIGIIVAIFMGIICSLIVRKILQPIGLMTSFITKMTNLDFTEDKTGKQLAARQDEFGYMARAIDQLQKKLASTIDRIKGQSSKLYSSSDGMYKNAYSMSETSEQVDKAVSEIAEGASSQAGETQKATENVITIGNMIEEASQEVKDLNEMASGMQNSNQVAIGILQELGSVNEQTRNSIGDIARQTVTTNESASKIREVTGLITEIAEETNLLSLNASIEAARAGDAGRGFAVVASQIQKLADQSSSSAKQIEEIVDRLISDSEQAVATMDQVKAIISKQSEDVERTGNAFGEVSEGIKNSMSVIQSISEKVRTMDEARVNVVDTVQNLTAIAEENAASTQESSASVTSITGIAVNIEQSSGDLKQIAMDLDEDMKEFKY